MAQSHAFQRRLVCSWVPAVNEHLGVSDFYAALDFESFFGSTEAAGSVLLSLDRGGVGAWGDESGAVMKRKRFLTPFFPATLGV